MSLLKAFLFSFICAVGSSGNAKTLSLVAAPGYEKVAAYKEAVEFAAAGIKGAGYQVKIAEVPRMRGAYSVDAGEYDALPIRGLDDEKQLPNVIVTSFPIAFTRFRVISLTENKNFEEAELKKFSGAIVLNNSSLQKEIRKRSLQVNEVNVSYPELVNMLILKRVDYIIAPEEIVASVLDADKLLKKKLRISDLTFIKTPLYFSLNRKHRELMPKIEKSFRKLLKGDLSKYKYIQKSLNSKLEQP